MTSRFLLHIIAPTIAISLLLLGLGALAAWNVQVQQATVSQMVTSQFHNSLEAQRLLLVVSDIRQMVRQYLRTRDEDFLDQMARSEPAVKERLKQLHHFAKSSTLPEPSGTRLSPLEIWTELDRSCKQVFEVLAEIRQIPQSDAKHTAAFQLDELLNEGIQRPIRAYVQSNEEAADHTNDANRQTAHQLFEAFLLLGVCGGTAGLFAGLAIARGLRRQMLQLNISVRGAADKLQEVVGPVSVSGAGGFGGLEHGLKEVENHIATIVERLQQRESESIRNQKFAAVGQLAAGLAHELRNPLMPMKMLVQRALNRPDSPGMTRRQLEVMDEEILRMEGLVQEFLDFAKPQPLERKRLDLLPVIRQAMDLVAARASIQDVELVCHLPESVIEVNADPLRLRQVLLNLLLNSLDAQAHGGQISIEVKVPQRLTGDRSPPFVLVQVTDQGIGIAEDLRSRIFEPFMSTKETGTGLGLPISQRIISNHGGTLEASNRPQGGAQFEIRLPLAEPVSPVLMIASNLEE